MTTLVHQCKWIHNLSQLSVLLGVLRMDRMLLGSQEPLWTEAATQAPLQLYGKKKKKFQWEYTDNATTRALPVFDKSLFAKIAPSLGGSTQESKLGCNNTHLSWFQSLWRHTSREGHQPCKASSAACRAHTGYGPGQFPQVSQVPALRSRTGERQEPNY